MKFQALRPVSLLKSDSSKDEFREAFKSTYFVEYLQTAASK